MKKGIVIFMSLILAIGAFSGCSGNAGNSSSTPVISDNSSASVVGADSSVSSESSQTDGSESSAQSASDMFSDSDVKDVSSETAHAEIVLSGSSATVSDSTRGAFSNGAVTITSKGIYHVSGSSEEVSIVISDSSESGNIYLILDNVSMSNTSYPCIVVDSADKVIIQTVGENTLSYQNQDSSVKEDGAVYAKDDITINGSGSLNIASALHGVVCKNDLKIANTTLNIEAANIGMKAEESLRISGGKVSVTASHDGVQLSNDDNTSFFYFENSEMTVNSGYDGISVKAGNDSAAFSGYVMLNGGKLNIVTASGSGSDSAKDSSTSQKGIKTDGNITIDQTELSISAADDAIHGNAAITVQSGTLTLSSGDDGITASGDLTVNGGSVSILKSYEGMEAANVTINNGNVSITASDDGINCAGGSDTTSSDDTPWSNGTDAALTINGGNVYVNSSGDGLDSNGSIYITGGTTIVEGPSASGNGAIDKGDGNGCVASITGGTVLAIGTADMAVNFDTGSQCSALVSASGSDGTTITVDDGSGFSFTATKSYACIVYSSPDMRQGNSYTLTSGSSAATLDFTSSLYYSDVSSSQGGNGGPGGMR